MSESTKVGAIVVLGSQNVWDGLQSEERESRADEALAEAKIALSNLVAEREHYLVDGVQVSIVTEYVMARDADLANPPLWVILQVDAQAEPLP